MTHPAGLDAAPDRAPAVERYGLKVAGCVLLAMLARVAYVLASWDFAPRVDNRDYLQRAVYLYHTGHFMPTVVGHAVIADAYWPPVFPLFLTVLVNVYQWLHDLGLWGPLNQWFTAQNYPAAPALGFIRFMRISEGIVTALGVLPLTWIAARLFGRRVALVAGVLLALFPPAVYVSDSLYSESLFTPLVLCAVAAALAYRDGRRWWWLVVAGLVTGLTALAHSDGLVLLLPLVVAVWPPAAGSSGRWRSLRDYRSGAGWGRRIRRLGPAAALIAVTLLTISPWTIRNAIELHAFVPVSDSAGRSLAGVYNSFSAHDPDQPGAFHQQFAQVAPFPQLFKRYPVPDPAQSSAQVHAALRYAEAHPLYPFEVAFWNTVRVLELTGGSGTEERAVREGINLSFAWVGDVAFWIVALLALAGCFMPALRRTQRWIWMVPAILYLAVLFINTSTPRFRAPIDPFVVLLAAIAVSGWWERRRGRRLVQAAGPSPPRESVG